MRAILYHGHKDVRLEEAPMPSLGPDQVLVKVAYNGICGSDLHEYCGPVKLQRLHPLAQEPLPRAWGHEMAGVIADVGVGVAAPELKAGVKVTINPTFGCGHCPSCAINQLNTCPKLGFIGIAGRGGGMSDYVAVPASQCHVVQPHVSLKAAALVEPAAVAWHAAKKANLTGEQFAFVLGCGPIGCLVIRALKAQGVKNIIVSEPSAGRRQFAHRSGASHVIDPAQEDVKDAVLAATSGLGCDAVLDAAGVSSLFPTLLAITKVRGSLINLAYWPKPISLNVQMDLTYSEKILTGSSCYHNQDYVEVVQALNDRTLFVDDLVSLIVPMDQVNEGIHRLLGADSDIMKLLIEANGEQPTETIGAALR